MIKQRLIFAAILLLSIMGRAQAQGIDPANLNLITFHNETGGTIEYVFLSPGDSGHWSTDILGSHRVLDNRDSLGFYIHYPNRCDEFDIMAIGGNGNAFTLFDYQICDGREAHITLDQKSLDESAPELDLVEIVLENELNYEIQYLFFSPGDSIMWGVDQLDAHTILQPGQAVSVLLPVQDREVRYDVQAVDEDHDSYTFFVEVDNSRDRFTFEVEPQDID